jgi:crotonobetainyl-CoA:carnitine CoA-transferase CaiB-like acyl-CoA transferase
MIESALNIAAEMVIEQSAYGAVLTRQGNRGPAAAPQGLYRCRGEDRWVAVAVGDDAQWAALRVALADPDWARADDLCSAAGRRSASDRIDEQLARWFADRDADEVVETLVASGVPSAVVTEPDQVIHNPQHRARGFVERFEHPLLGAHEVLGVPFRFSSRVGEQWITRPAPTLGQHNDEVLGGELGVSVEERQRLRESKVTGERPVGW